MQFMCVPGVWRDQAGQELGQQPALIVGAMAQQSYFKVLVWK